MGSGLPGEVLLPMSARGGLLGPQHEAPPEVLQLEE